MGFNGEDNDSDGTRKSRSLPVLQKWWDKVRQHLAGDEEIRDKPSAWFRIRQASVDFKSNGYVTVAVFTW